MDQYITLVELYIYDCNLFKSKNLKSFYKVHRVPEGDIVPKRRGGQLAGVTKSWVETNLVHFPLWLSEWDETRWGVLNHYPLESWLEKNVSSKVPVNPVMWNFDSECLVYFFHNGRRTPFLTPKGVVKLQVFYNLMSGKEVEWFYEISNGFLKPHLHQLSNVRELVRLKHAPVVVGAGGPRLVTEGVYSLRDDDFVVDCSQIAAVKRAIERGESHQSLRKYQCPLFVALTDKFQDTVKLVEKKFEVQLNELKAETTIQVLREQLRQEKKLKEQVLSLTQSFIPTIGGRGEEFGKPDETPSSASVGDDNFPSSTNHTFEARRRPSSLSSGGALKPSKIL
ncbi:hypothetical protein MIV028R [Invertebrate iridescent virus 3]|uniref:Uncharacterized protein 028R n=1 Tax=Invertebrate iridescent virus 3 TaxID=345201 RepID=028R_IIV3|nr:hypothetical protein MIV028R [Invertebrate iridescent virus 3]Q197D2.1 RecName: Full=Uncharacterized protein 028R [Invertebrate iridescent virus 3]ABF82058.1 hypothetical protein MIV028R [Invertebrate iridescent virus 3]